MRHWIRGLTCAVVPVLFGVMHAAHAGDIGVVLLHGGKGSPVAANYLGGLALDLRRAGHEVATPAMPWAAGRYYDATFDDAMREIDREVDALRQKGATRIVVAGHSFGANAVLGYAASRDTVAGVIALAPGHAPEVFFKDLQGDISRAKEMVAAGKGKEMATFQDINQGRTFSVRTTAEIYLSWLDPDGKAVMPTAAAAIRKPVPLLLVVGRWEQFARGRDYIFDKAPPHPNSRFVVVTADHYNVPDAASDEVRSWLIALPK